MTQESKEILLEVAEKEYTKLSDDYDYASATAQDDYVGVDIERRKLRIAIQELENE